MSTDLPAVLMPTDTAIKGFTEVCNDVAEFLGTIEISLEQGSRLDPMELAALKAWQKKLKRATALYSMAR